MSAPPTYVLDTNVFIEAARRYYAFDLVPQFWERLVEQARNGRLRSIDRVKAEIDRGDDPLAGWANTEFVEWFVPTGEPDVAQAYGQVMVWGQGEAQFTDAAKAEFARAENADAWVVAYARATECVVVTHEEFRSGIRRGIPIPNACRAFGIQYVDTFQMLRDLGVTLVG